MLRDISEGLGPGERGERLGGERWEGNSAEMHKGVAKRLDFLLRGWTLTSGPCNLSWITVPKVNAVACGRGQSLKSAASRALCCS